MIVLVMSHPAQAKVVAKAFKMRTLGKGAFREWVGDGVRLIVGGSTRTSAAAATAYAARHLKECERAGWIHIGFGIHPSYPPGTAWLAHRMRDPGSRFLAYPTLLIERRLKSISVRTVDSRDAVPSGEEIDDREGSGFYETALLFSSSELVHAIRIVGARSWADFESLEGREGAGLLAPSLEAIRECVLGLQTLVAQRSWGDAEGLEVATERWRSHWRFSFTESERLKTLLRRLAVGGVSLCECFERHKHRSMGSDVLRELAKEQASTRLKSDSSAEEAGR